MTVPMASTGEKPDRSRHWAQLGEFSFVGGMRLLFGIYRVLGRFPFRLVLYPVVLWYVLTQRTARAASRNYLRQISAFGSTPPMAVSQLNVLRHFAAFAESILDKMVIWSGLFPTEKAVIHGHEPVVQRIAAGGGGLLICAHLGNLELCRMLSTRRAGLKLTVLVHTKHAQAFNRMLAQLNPSSQLNLVQVTEMSPAVAMMLHERVSRGEFVVIAGDRIPVSPHPRVAWASFLGKPAPFPVGPYVLASVLQCPVYLLFSMRTSDGGSEIHIELFREEIRLPRRGRDDTLADLIANYAARLEYHCRRAPLQWFNFYDFWQLPVMDQDDASH